MDLPDPLVRDRATRARVWFDDLRDQLVAAFEELEDEAPEALYDGPPGRFELKPWVREAGGGGVMGFLRGRFFEKCGLHVSEVHGTFTPEMAKTMPGALDDPRFVATGVSLIAHMRNPRVPAVHMNTRYIATTAGWFGGGADLTPLLDEQRTQEFSRRHSLPRGAGARLRGAWRGPLCPLQGRVRPVFLSAAPGRTARDRRHLL